MALNLLYLDDRTRKLMVDEMEADSTTGKLYLIGDERAFLEALVAERERNAARRRDGAR